MQQLFQLQLQYHTTYNLHDGVRVCVCVLQPFQCVRSRTVNTEYRVEGAFS